MYANLEDFKTGWYGLSLGLSEDEIDNLVAALQRLKSTKNHFHFRSNFEGAGGLGDIEIYLHPTSQAGTLYLEAEFRDLKD